MPANTVWENRPRGLPTFSELTDAVCAELPSGRDHVGPDAAGYWPGAVSRSNRIGRDLGRCGQGLRTIGLDLVAHRRALAISDGHRERVWRRALTREVFHARGAEPCGSELRLKGCSLVVS